MSSKPLINLLSWISSGILAGVSPGDTKEHVRHLLGNPFGWTSTLHSNAVMNFMDVDIWGYGAWTLYFEGDTLDAVTCLTNLVNKHGWYFDIEKNIPPNFFNCLETAEKTLVDLGIPCMKVEDHYYEIRNVHSGEVLKRRRRLNLPTVLAGDEFRTRILFSSENGAMDIIGNPFSIRRQVLSHKKLDPKNSYVFEPCNA